MKATLFTALLFLAELMLFPPFCDQNRDQCYGELLVTYEPLHVALHVFAILASFALTAALVCCALASAWGLRVAYVALFAAATALEYSVPVRLPSVFGCHGHRALSAPHQFRDTDGGLRALFQLDRRRSVPGACRIPGLAKPRRPGLGWKALPMMLAVTLAFYVAMSRYRVLYAHTLKYPVISVQAAARTTGDYLASVTILPEIERDVIATVPQAVAALPERGLHRR